MQPKVVPYLEHGPVQLSDFIIAFAECVALASVKDTLMTFSAKHIGIFVPSLNLGGVQRSMVVLANSLSSAGHEVDLVLNRATGVFLPEVSPQVRIVELGAHRVLLSVVKLAQYLRAERPQALITGMTYVNLAAIWARQLAGTKTQIVATERNDRTGRSPASLSDRLVAALAVPSYRLADKVVGVSDGVSRYVARKFRLPRSSVTTIYNPVDISSVLQKAAEPLTEEWLSNGDGPLIVAVGRLAPQKDFATLLRAVAEASRSIDLRLVILGEGESRAALEELVEQLGIKSRVHLAGLQANPYKWMRRADLFVLSSIFEGLGNVVIEAMACGTAIVSTDCPSGPREILEDGKWGRLVPPSNPSALAAAMIAALSDPCPPDVTKRAADFDAPIVARKYLKVMDA